MQPNDRSLLKLFSRMAPPLVMRCLIIGTLQFFLKRAILGKKDQSVLAAYAIISNVESLVFILVFNGLHIVSATVSRLNAHEAIANPTEIGVTYRQGVLLGTLLMLPTAILCITAPTVFAWLDQPATIVESSTIYFRYSFFAYLADMLYRTQARIVIGLSQPHIALIADTVESVLDVTLTYLLVNGKYGFPEMGIQGAAIAYVIAATTTAAGNFFYLRAKKDFKKYELFRFEFLSAFQSPQFKKLLLGGLQISLHASILSITQIITRFLLGLHGEAPLAALEAALGCGYVISLLIAGLSEAASVIVGYLAQNHPHDAFRAGNITIAGSVLVTILLTMPGFIYPQMIMRCFFTHDQYQRNAVLMNIFLRIQMVMEIINSASNSGSDVLSGFLETRKPFLFSFIFVFILNASCVLAAHFFFHQNPTVLYGIQLIGLALNAIGIVNCWRIMQERKNMILESPRHIDAEQNLPMTVFSPA